MERFFLVPWLAPALAVLLLAMLCACLIASYWWRNRPTNAAFDARTGGRRFLPLMIFVAPGLVGIGFLLILFPVGVPESVVLRSRAFPESADLDPTCTMQAFAKLKLYHSTQGDCPVFQPDQSSRTVDAGPLVQRALDHFDARNFTSAQIEGKAPEVLAALREAVSIGLTIAPPSLQALPDKPGSKPQRRWLVQSIEIGILEGLSLARNVRNIVVEVHPLETDETQIDPWQRLAVRLENQTKAHRPLVYIVEGSKRGRYAYAEIVGVPWLRPRNGAMEIFAMIAKGRQESDARISVTAGNDDTPLPLKCGSSAGALYVLLHSCASGFSSSEAGTKQLIALRIDGHSGPGPYWLNLTIEKSGETSQKPLQAIDNKRVRVAASAPLRSTLQCLLDRSSTFRTLLTAGGRQDFELTSTDADVAISYAGGTVTVQPASARAGLVAEIEDQEKPAVSDNGSAGRGLGLMLFPYISRSDAGPLAIGNPLEVPIKPARDRPYIDASKDPALDVKPLRSTWINRGDARPAAFSYARQNNIQWVDSIEAQTVTPVAWRIDVVEGRTDGHLATIWRFAIDLDEQGLLLQAGCRNFANTPTGAQLDKAFSLYEPNYESTRFFPFWAAILSAARISASPDSELAFQAQTTAKAPPILMNEVMRSQIQMRSAQTGLYLVLLGIILHMGFMIFLRVRSERS